MCDCRQTTRQREQPRGDGHPLYARDKVGQQQTTRGNRENIGEDNKERYHDTNIRDCDPNTTVGGTHTNRRLKKENPRLSKPTEGGRHTATESMIVSEHQ